MNRRKFIATGCFSCVSAGLLLSVLDSCSGSKMYKAAISDSDMIVPVAAFQSKKGQAGSYKKSLVLHNDLLQYPICLVRFDEDHYEALLMKCTHQGTELQVFGDKLQCPAHGSEFDSHGTVSNGPAGTSLRTFPVTIENHQIKISLK